MSGINIYIGSSVLPTQPNVLGPQFKAGQVITAGMTFA